MEEKRDKDLSQMSLEELWQLFPIYLTEHREEWDRWYEEERDRLAGLLPMDAFASISHVGSTSIRGIWAKPVVDILAELRPGSDMQEMKTKLEKSGYLCMEEKPGRVSFNKGYTPGGYTERVFHLHLRAAGDNDELYFRDYLREHREAAEEYETLKLGLWKKYEHDRDGYTESKGELVKRYTGEARKLYGGRYDR